jgi:hypothetical protein
MKINSHTNNTRHTPAGSKQLTSLEAHTAG